MKRVSLLLALLSTIRCDGFVTEDRFVPDVQSVRSRFADFIIGDVTTIVPIARYNDVDAMVASYCLKGRQITMADVVQKASSAGWRVKDTEVRAAMLGRSDGARSYEYVKVRDGGGGCFAVAWLQADVDSSQADASSELAWAKEYVWPKLDEVAARLARSE
jgi:hypothetical protein